MSCAVFTKEAIQFSFELDEESANRAPATLECPSQYKIVRKGNTTCFEVIGRFGHLEKAMTDFTNAIVGTQ